MSWPNAWNTAFEDRLIRLLFPLQKISFPSVILAIFGFLIVTLSSGFSIAAPLSDTDSHVVENSAFRVVVPSDREALGKAFLDLAVRARVNLGENSKVSFPYQTTILWCETESEFLEFTGHRPESVVAAASAARSTIWINGPAWQRSGAEEAYPILLHEYAHLVVGTLSPIPLPRWANEGLVMHLAGQWTLRDGFQSTRAQLFGGLPSLERIEKEFPQDGESMRRAYLIGYLAVEQMARSMGAKPGNVDPILDRMKDPQRGRQFVASLWDADVRAAIEADVHSALGNSARKWVIYLTSGTTIWAIIVGLFLIAYWRKRSRSAAAAEREHREEPWVESLTDADIVEIYGEPRDTVEEEDNERPWE